MGVWIKQESYNGDAVLSTTYVDDYSVKGRHFVVNQLEAIAKATTKTMLLDLSSVDIDKCVFLQPIAMNVNGASIELKIYEDTDYSGGTQIASYNVNRCSESIADAVLTNAPTGTDKGTLIRDHIAFSTGIGVNLTAGQGGGINITILDRSKNYLLELINADAVNGATIEWIMSWFEV